MKYNSRNFGYRCALAWKAMSEREFWWRIECDASYQCGLLAFLWLLLDRQTARNAIHLIAGLDLAHFCDLCRRCGLGVHVGDAARKSAQCALGGGMHDASLLHFLAHQLYDIFMHDDRVIGHERSHSDRIINGHERLDAGTEVAVVLFPQRWQRPAVL